MKIAVEAKVEDEREIGQIIVLTKKECEKLFWTDITTLLFLGVALVMSVVFSFKYDVMEFGLISLMLLYPALNRFSDFIKKL